MEKGYKNVVWLFASVAILAILGFSPTYFFRLGSPGDFSIVHHVHGFVMILWLALLIVQPVLIMKGKIGAHRFLGKVTYFIMPVLIVLMLLAYKGQYVRGETNGDPHEQNLAILLLPVTDTLPFLVLFILAVVNRKERSHHMRYMIANALVLIGPPLGRMLFIGGLTDFFVVSIITYLTTDIILMAMTGYDAVKGKSFKLNPYLVSCAVLILCQSTLLYLPNTRFWQSVASGIVGNFF